jgi:hypothetical protein
LATCDAWVKKKFAKLPESFWTAAQLASPRQKLSQPTGQRRPLTKLIQQRPSKKNDQYHSHLKLVPNSL